MQLRLKQLFMDTHIYTQPMHEAIAPLLSRDLW